MNRSLWWQRADPEPLRAPLDREAEADVAIIGAGFTGLWTAYYLTQLAPGIRVRVLEAGRVGFGASGRNGGWCSALFPAEPHTVAREYGAEAATAMQRTMHETVGVVGHVVAEHGIDCDWSHGGTVYLARSQVQVERGHAMVEAAREFGFGEADYRWLDAEPARARIGATDTLGAVYTPHCAAVDPLKLLRGVATVAERQGAVINEATRVHEISPGQVATDRGTVRARHVIRATEAYTALLPGAARTITPVYSLMVATEPLPDAVWDEIGLAERETFNDLRHLIIYGQRTADGRLAFGGRGAPYHAGSAIRPDFDDNPRVHDALVATLTDLFPVLAGVRITHRWGGPLGIARDWWARAAYDPVTGMGWAGGYVGDGVGTSNLAGRTLAHLVTGTPSALLDLPWVNRPLRRWEPEPLRWLGANAALTAMKFADATEARTGRPSRVAGAVHRLLGT